MSPTPEEGEGGDGVHAAAKPKNPLPVPHFMRARALVPLLLLVMLMAGCISADVASPASVDDAGTADDPEVPPGQYEPHPAYGFPTNGLLPVADGNETRIVQQDGTVQWFRPKGADLPGTLSSMQAVTHVDGTSTGGGIAVLGPLAFIGGRSSGPLQVVDLSDPTQPEVVGEVENVPVRDADTILFPDGRLVVVTTAGGSEQFATDVTDPEDPVQVGSITTDHGNHNIAVVPGTPIVYNSGSGGVIDIVDYSDPANPAPVGTFENDQNCHDITFYIDDAEEKYRAYCAGYGESQIWDITDPTAPEMVTRIPYPSVEQGLPLVDPGVEDQGVSFPLSFSHLAIPNHDASVLIVGDETGGGAINGCDVYTEATGSPESGPTGNLWFYDITDETDPELRGHVSPSFTDADGSCTAHFGRVVEDTGHVAVGFYAAGVVLVDYNDLDEPRIVDRLDQGGSIWDVWYHQGYLLTGDMSRGMDVLGLE